MKIKYYIGFLFFLGVFIVSCSDDQCNLDTESLLTLEINIEDPVLEAANYTDGLSIYSPEWNDSIHYWVEKADSIMLSPDDSITTLIFTSTNESLKDTLFIYHQNNLRLLSMECGFVIDYKIDSAPPTWNLIDSVKIIEDEITYDAEGLIQIYF